MIVRNLSAIKVIQAKEKGFIYDLQTKPFSLFDKRDFFSALLDRRGAETDERSEFGSAGWWISDRQEPFHPERSEGSPPPRLQTLASLGLVSCPKMSLHKTFLNGRVKENRTTSVF